jgi:peroxiredoxin
MSRILHGAAIVLAALLSGTAIAVELSAVGSPAPASHKAFAEQHSLPFTILVGSGKSVTRSDLKQLIAQPARAKKT